MTPAITALRRAGVDFEIREYPHDPQAESFGLEAATALNVPVGRVFKTLLVAVTGLRVQHAVAIVPVANRLNLKAVAASLAAKKAEMAQPRDAERVTGYVLGGISPFGQRRVLPTVLDDSAKAYSSILVSGGKRGLDIELAPTDLVRVCGAEYADLKR